MPRHVRLAEDWDTFDSSQPSFQSLLTKEEIDEKLRDYVMVDSLRDVPLGTHLRYFKKVVHPETGAAQHLFRTGGELVVKTKPDLYVVLRAAAGKTFSAQVKDGVFFRKMTPEECHQQADLLAEEHRALVRSLQKKISRLERKLARSEQAREEQLAAIKRKYTLTKK